MDASVFFWFIEEAKIFSEEKSLLRRLLKIGVSDRGDSPIFTKHFHNEV